MINNLARDLKTEVAAVTGKLTEHAQDFMKTAIVGVAAGVAGGVLGNVSASPGQASRATDAVQQTAEPDDEPEPPPDDEPELPPDDDGISHHSED